MKNSKAKNGSRSSQISSLRSIWPILLFHIKIFSLITSHKCISWQRFRNKCMSEEAKWPDPRTSAAWQSLRASFSWHPHTANINAAFCGPFLLGPTFSRKVSCYSHDQTAASLFRKLQLTEWGKWLSLLGLWDVGKEERVLYPFQGEKKTTNQQDSCILYCTKIHVWVYAYSQPVKDDFFLSIKHDCEWQWHPGLTAVFNSYAKSLPWPASSTRHLLPLTQELNQ